MITGTVSSNNGALTIIERKGDLFTSLADAYMHGCNTRGRMGAGIARDFAAFDPEMFQDYRRRCKHNLQPGEGYIFHRQEKPHIINLMTQANLGGAEIEYVESAFEWLATEIPGSEIRTIAMPRIGAGLGGLDWEVVRRSLVKHLGKCHDLQIEIWRPK